MKSLFRSTVICGGALLAVGACTKKSGDGAPATGASAGKTELHIGSFFPLSGGQATFGEDSVNGVKLAVDEINANASDVVVKLTSEDEKSEPADAANAVQKLINVDRVNVVIGSVASSNTMAAAPIAQGAGIPLLTPASTNVKVTEIGDFVSRICFIDDFQGEAMAKFAAQDLGAKKAAVVIDLASDYSKGLAASFKDAFVKQGGSIVVEVSYQAKDQDFSSQLTRVKGANPDVIFVPGYYTEVGNMIRQAKALKINAKFLGGDGWSSDTLFSLAGDAIEGHFYAAHFFHEDSDPAVLDFVKKYQAKYNGKIPSDMAALGYDAVYVVVDALRRAGMKTDPVSLKDAINNTKDFKAVTGTITLDANRNARKGLIVLETTKTTSKFKKRVEP